MRSLLLAALTALAAGCAGGTAPSPLPREAQTPATEPAASLPAIAQASAQTSPTDPPQGGTRGSAPTTSEADAKAANGVALRLFRKAHNASANVMLSGASLRRALGATYLGAAGETAREMAVALDFADPRTAATLAKEERTAWDEAKGKAELVVADRVWVEKKLPIRQDFAKLASDAFGAPAEPIDFARAPDAARRTVNAWVAEKTSNKIVDLLPSGSVDTQTRLIVTNAIYFKARWTLPFAKGATKDETFHAENGKDVTAPMMHGTESHRFAQVGDTKVLELRYEGSDLAMIIALPDDRNGLARLEENLTADTFEQWTQALQTKRVAVTLPKYTFRSGGPMNAPLQELGIRTAFTSNADFSGIADMPTGEHLAISQVVHQTYVAVDEIGTEAAAATGIVMRTTSMPLGPVVELKADHPFLFFIHDAKRARILFVGRVANPKSG